MNNPQIILVTGYHENTPRGIGVAFTPVTFLLQVGFQKDCLANLPFPYYDFNTFFNKETIMKGRRRKYNPNLPRISINKNGTNLHAFPVVR